MRKFKLFAMATMLAVGGLSMVGCSDVNDEIVQAAASKITFTQKRVSDSQLQLAGTWTVKVDNVAHTVKVDWAGEPAERFTFERSEDESTVFANINLPDKGKNEADVSAKLKATISYNNAKTTKEFNTTLAAVEKLVTMTTAEAKATEIDTNLTVKGVAVDAHADGNGFFIVDETGVIYVYDKAAKHRGELTYGQEVIVKGKRAVNTKQIKNSSGEALGDPVQVVQMTYESCTVVSTAQVEVPVNAAVDTTVANVLAWSKDPTSESFVNHAGEFIHVQAKIATFGTYTPPTYEAMDDAGKYINFYANTVNNASEGYVEELSQYIDVKCDIYLAVMDINTSGSNKTTWRTVPVKVVPLA